MAGASGTFCRTLPSMNQEPSIATGRKRSGMAPEARAWAGPSSRARTSMSGSWLQRGSGARLSTNTTARPVPRSVAVTVSASTRPSRTFWWRRAQSMRRSTRRASDSGQTKSEMRQESWRSRVARSWRNR